LLSPGDRHSPGLFLARSTSCLLLLQILEGSIELENLEFELAGLALVHNATILAADGQDTGTTSWTLSRELLQGL